MVFARAKLNELSKEELIEEFLSFDNLSEKINDLTKKWMILHQNLIVFFLNCKFPKPAIHYYTSKLLIWRDHPWAMLNIWEDKWLRVPLELSNNELEGLVCKALSLTGNEVYSDDLEVCHRLKKKQNVIVKFKSRKLKYKVINNRKIMKNKSKELNELKFSNNFYISENM